MRRQGTCIIKGLPPWDWRTGVPRQPAGLLRVGASAPTAQDAPSRTVKRSLGGAHATVGADSRRVSDVRLVNALCELTQEHHGQHR